MKWRLQFPSKEGVIQISNRNMFNTVRLFHPHWSYNTLEKLLLVNFIKHTRINHHKIIWYGLIKKIKINQTKKPHLLELPDKLH